MSGTVAVPIPKSFLNLNSDLFEGVYNVWFFTKDTMPAIKSPIEIPLLPRKVTILSSLDDTGRWGVQVRIEPKPDGSQDQAGIQANIIITALAAIGVLVAGYLTFDKIEKVVDENSFTFGLFGVVAVIIAFVYLIRAWKS